MNTTARFVGHRAANRDTANLSEPNPLMRPRARVLCQPRERVPATPVIRRCETLKTSCHSGNPNRANRHSSPESTGAEGSAERRGLANDNSPTSELSDTSGIDLGTAMELLSQRAYARRRGVSQAAVWKAIQTGRISTVRGKIDPETADCEWAANTDPSKPRNSIVGEPKRTRPIGEPSKPTDLDGACRVHGGNGEARARNVYVVARATRERCLAQMARLELEERMQQLVRRDEVQLAAVTAARSAREKLLALPQRVSGSIAAADDPTEVRRILEEEIEQVCLEISGGWSE